jgi:hypothetical protein
MNPWLVHMGPDLSKAFACASLMMLTVTMGGDMCTFNFVPTRSLTVAENLTSTTLIFFSSSSSTTLRQNKLERLRFSTSMSQQRLRMYSQKLGSKFFSNGQKRSSLSWQSIS